MITLSPKVRLLALRTILCALLVLAGWLGWRWLRPWLFPPSPLVVTPQLALESLQGQSLDYNGVALPWLVARRPELLRAEDKAGDGLRARAFAQGAQSAKLFRQMDRQFRFDTVVLFGDPSNYQRLLDHLLEPEVEQRDFRLVYLDHWALVFKRNAPREWELADAEKVRARVAGTRAEDRAAFLAKAAAKMLAVRQYESARRWLDDALALDGGSVDALAGMGGYYISLGKWKEAESYADKALAKDERSPQAVAVKVLAMRATNHKGDAFKFSVRLNTLIPVEPVRLWQHALLAHDAAEYEAEIAALGQLIQLAKDGDRPVGDYEFQLGEAHTFAAMQDMTHTPLAVEHLKKALADPLLPAEKRKFAEERLKTIRERTGAK